MADGTITLDDLNVTAPAPPVATDDTVTIEVAGQRWTGWQRVAVTRSIDTVPATFDLQVTERYPTSGQIDIKPGAPCKVLIGSDVVITGYVDRYTAAVSPRDHTVRITGRSKSADLVDCAAFFGSKDTEAYFSAGGSAVKIVRELAAGYDIEVSQQSGGDARIIPFAINLGETAWEIIDRVTRMAALLAYDMPDGSIMLSIAGTGTMDSGFVQGVNVESAAVEFTIDQRFSRYYGFTVTTAALTVESAQSGGTLPAQGRADDPDVPRFRKRIIVEPGIAQTGENIIQKRVDWEKNRRIGRSLAVTVTCDSWRDVGGALWAPNYLAPINLPALKLANATWCIGTVTYTRDEGGQHATVVLMPKDAFIPEPYPLPIAPLLQNLGIAPNNPTAKEPPT